MWFFERNLTPQLKLLFDSTITNGIVTIKNSIFQKLTRRWVVLFNIWGWAAMHGFDDCVVTCKFLVFALHEIFWALGKADAESGASDICLQPRTGTTFHVSMSVLGIWSMPHVSWRLFPQENAYLNMIHLLTLARVRDFHNAGVQGDATPARFETKGRRA